MLTGMGLALGIDYSLFVVSRFREERRAGRSDSTRSRTPARPRAGRCCSAARLRPRAVGMLLVPNTIMRSLAAGAILVGIVSVIAALTLLPRHLGAPRGPVDALLIPSSGRRLARGANPATAVLGRIVRRVMRRPVLGRRRRRRAGRACDALFRIDTGTAGVGTLPDPSRPGRATSRSSATSRRRTDRPDRRLQGVRRGARRARGAARTRSLPTLASATAVVRSAGRRGRAALGVGRRRRVLDADRDGARPPQRDHSGGVRGRERRSSSAARLENIDYFDRDRPGSRSCWRSCSA